MSYSADSMGAGRNLSLGNSLRDFPASHFGELFHCIPQIVLPDPNVKSFCPVLSCEP